MNGYRLLHRMVCALPEQADDILANLEHPFITNLITVRDAEPSRLTPPRRESKAVPSPRRPRQVFNDEKRVMVIYEYVNGGELRTWLKESDREAREFAMLSPPARSRARGRATSSGGCTDSMHETRRPLGTACQSRREDLQKFPSANSLTLG